MCCTWWRKRLAATLYGMWTIRGMDRASHTVRRGEMTIAEETTNKELLEFLLMLADKVQSHHVVAAIHKTISRLKEQDQEIKQLRSQLAAKGAELEEMKVGELVNGHRIEYGSGGMFPQCRGWYACHVDDKKHERCSGPWDNKGEAAKMALRIKLTPPEPASARGDEETHGA